MSQPDTDPARQLLLECSLLLSSFRWLNKRAGYAFREPPGIDAMLARIDALCFPDERGRPGRKPRSAEKGETTRTGS